MKKFIRLIAVAAFVFGVAGMSAGSSVQAMSCDDMTISNTGPDSENRILCQDETSITIQCSNNTIITIDLDQNSESGDAEVEGNTNGGSASSGGATNENNVEVDVNNVCANATTSEEPEEPTTPVKPTETVAVAATPVAVTAEKPQTVAALPNTGNVSPIQGLIAVASIAAAALIGRFGYSAYLSKHNK